MRCRVCDRALLGPSRAQNRDARLRTPRDLGAHTILRTLRICDAVELIDRGLPTGLQGGYFGLPATAPGSMPCALMAGAAAGPERNVIQAAAPFSSLTELSTPTLMTILSVNAGGSGERKERPGTILSSAI